MSELQAITSIIETLGIVGICLLWLRDKNDQIRHERDARHELSDDILEDWKHLKSNRSQGKKEDS